MFENIPKNWEKDKLKNILDILRNGANIKQFDNADGIPISRIETIANGYVDFNKVGYANIYDDKYKDYYIQKGDILLSHINSVAHLGKCAFCNFDSKLIHGMNLLLLRANQNILPKFLYYLLNSQILKKQLPSITKKSVNQASMSTTNLGNLNVIYPINKNEQQEIVDVLDAASEIIRLRTACIESAQSLIPALFQEMFGDINNNIHSLPISEIKSCVEINPTKIVMNDNDDVTFLGMKDVTENGQIDLSTIKKYEEVKKGFTSFKNDDVLLAKITPCFENGKAAIAKNLVNNTGFGSTEFYVLRPNQNKILPEYLYSIVKSSRFSEMGRSNMKGAAGQKRLIKDFVSNYKFLLPDIPQQKLFAAKVQEIEAYIKTQQAELENAKAMFQSLLHYAFMGELTKYLQKSN